jgi:hypothetical protein
MSDIKGYKLFCEEFALGYSLTSQRYDKLLNFKSADVTSVIGIGLRLIDRPALAALIRCDAGTTTGVNSRAAGGERMSLGGTTVVLQRPKQGIGVGEIARSGKNGAAGSIANEIVTKRGNGTTFNIAIATRRAIGNNGIVQRGGASSVVETTPRASGIITNCDISCRNCH